jgi:hypothetical protein
MPADHTAALNAMVYRCNKQKQLLAMEIMGKPARMCFFLVWGAMKIGH